jgi:phage tail-like protein
MTDRIAPYGAFNFLVSFDGSEILGGFSDVSGLGTELVMAEYREGNDPLNRVQKVAGMYKSTDVTLKRGMLNSQVLWSWIDQARTNWQAAQRQMTITLLDEARTPVQKWVLQGVLPMKYTGPTMAAKTSTDVAMEELVLSAEDFKIEAP